MLKKCVLSSFLNMAMLASARMSGGSEFHAAGPACEKERTQYVHMYAIQVAIMFTCAYQYFIHRRGCISLNKEAWQTMTSYKPTVVGKRFVLAKCDDGRRWLLCVEHWTVLSYPGRICVFLAWKFHRFYVGHQVRWGEKIYTVLSSNFWLANILEIFEDLTVRQACLFTLNTNLWGKTEKNISLYISWSYN